MNFKRLSELKKAARTSIEERHSDLTEEQKRGFEIGFIAGANYWMRNGHHHLRFKKGDVVEYANKVWTVDMWENTDDDHYVLTECNPKSASPQVMHVEFERDVLFRSYKEQENDEDK